MALISCPECENRISESASSCPNCGYCLTTEEITKIKNQEQEREKERSRIEELDKIAEDKNHFHATIWSVLIAIVIVYMCCGGGFSSCSNNTAISEKGNWRSRVESDAIPSRAGNGVSERDIAILWRGAQYMLENGKCNRIDYADKSTSRPGVYFVMDGYKKIYFTEDDIR